ncbi:hypothetical protein [Actinomadura kijaniata]|uniref:hypothetical protein n=1 Tax=Actinomadura kijaniata TaxID=46161 RepID=UPI0008355602|nr:hypothetical protein [Actinomadura kijaniata]
MSGDLVWLAGEVTPYVTAAASAYGGALLARVQDEAVDGTVGFGRRMAQRLFGERDGAGEVPEALADVIDDPADADNVAALREAVRGALAADAELADEVRRLLDEAAGSQGRGHGNVFIGGRVEGDNIQIGSVGRDATIRRA